MKTLILLLCILSVVGCAQRPARPHYYPALDYPYGNVSDLYAGTVLKFEGKDFGLDGGSRVYILSTPDKRKIQLWDLCVVAKKDRGLDSTSNAFMLVLGPKNEDTLIVAVGSEIESHLIASMPKEIAAGIVDRKHAIHY